MHSPKGRWRRRGAAGAALLRCLAILAVLALLLVLLLRGSGSSPAPRSFRELASSDDAEAGSALHADQGVCPVAQPHTEYGGEPVRWGADHVTEDAAACCAACAAVSVCGAWVFCDSPTGCTGGGERKRGECWLKARAPHPARPPVASSGPTVGWTSGALFTPADAAAAEAADAAVLSERDAVRFAPGNRRVFLDVEVDGVPAGRMEALLFVNDALAPRAASNFLAFARGDTVDALGNNRTWVGARFYRILDQARGTAGVGKGAA